MNNTTIKFSRSGFIEQSYDVALIRLNEFQHAVGQPVVVRYYTTGNKVNAITAIGINDGTGRDSYRIISNGEVVPVNKIYPDRLEDISQLIHQEVAVCRYDGKLYFCQCDDGVMKRLYEITTDTVFYNGADGFNWYYNAETDVLKRADDFMTASEVKASFDRVMTLIANISTGGGDNGGGNGNQGGGQGEQGQGQQGGGGQQGGETTVVIGSNNLVKCVFSVFPTTLLYTGEDVEITASFAFTFMGENIVPKNLNILKDSDSVYSTPIAENNITIPVNKRGKTTITLRAVLDVTVLTTTEEQTLEQKVDLYMYPPTKAVMSSESSYNQINEWTTNASLFSYPGEVTITGIENGYLWFAIPDEVQFSGRFLMSSIEFEVVNSGTNDGFTYYRSAKQQVPGTYKIRLE